MTLTKRTGILTTLALALLVGLFALVAASAAGAAQASFPRVSATGELGTPYGGSPAAVTFEAHATGPAAPGEEHQPARGSVHFEVQNGLAFTAAVEHIHAHSATEVHFGGPITRSNDPSLVGSYVHCVAISGSPDQFSLMITAGDTHEHGSPAPLLWGQIRVSTPGH